MSAFKAAGPRQGPTARQTTEGHRQGNYNSLTTPCKPYPPGSELESRLRYGKTDFRAIVLVGDLHVPGYILPESDIDIQVFRVPHDVPPIEYFWPIQGIQVTTCMYPHNFGFHRMLVESLLAHKAREVISMIIDPDVEGGLDIIDLNAFSTLCQIPTLRAA